MVIQRWQTLLLLIATVLMAIFSFCTLGQFQGSDITVDFSALGMTVEQTGETYMPTIFLFIVALLATLLPLLAICRFKAPKVQRRIVWWSVIIVIGAIASAWITAAYANIPGSGGISWSFLAIAPVIALVAELLAIRCISADIRLLDGYNRLR